ncbi:hypothetical protein H072_4632 [Dactylellina haptotyla CBS 200.50]|uniref:Uncharacterized protein n=1 Tax=Dactylellina haptotyla (strain CBS 200.50) TaxID=1284197 RepID=S8BPT4_DACHA|nr:hypothetical protein H072_4632 [Dactylellina haptotyla CBS 200.50]
MTRIGSGPRTGVDVVDQAGPRACLSSQLAESGHRNSSVSVNEAGRLKHVRTGRRRRRSCGGASAVVGRTGSGICTLVDPAGKKLRYKLQSSARRRTSNKAFTLKPLDDLKDGPNERYILPALLVSGPATFITVRRFTGQKYPPLQFARPRLLPPSWPITPPSAIYSHRLLICFAAAANAPGSLQPRPPYPPRSSHSSQHNRLGFFSVIAPFASATESSSKTQLHHHHHHTTTTTTNMSSPRRRIETDVMKLYVLYAGSLDFCHSTKSGLILDNGIITLTLPEPLAAL